MSAVLTVNLISFWKLTTKLISEMRVLTDRGWATAFGSDDYIQRCSLFAVPGVLTIHLIHKQKIIAITAFGDGDRFIQLFITTRRGEDDFQQVSQVVDLDCITKYKHKQGLKRFLATWICPESNEYEEYLESKKKLKKEIKNGKDS